MLILTIWPICHVGPSSHVTTNQILILTIKPRDTPKSDVSKMDTEEQWKLRVILLLRTEGRMKPGDIGMQEPRPGRKQITNMLKSDNRFFIDRSDPIHGCRISLAQETVKSPLPKRQKKIVQKIAPPPPFHPAKTTFSPPHLCWEVILTNPKTAATLSSWRWMWTLPQVCKVYRASMQMDRWINWTCVEDKTPTIWKTKANELLALTVKDLEDVECRVVHGSGWKKRYETHLMRRDTLLQLALAKHGGTYKGINAVFLKKKEAKKKRKKPCRRRCYEESTEEDEPYW
jgi:hypothetical protein